MKKIIFLTAILLGISWIGYSQCVINFPRDLYNSQTNDATGMTYQLCINEDEESYTLILKSNERKTFRNFTKVFDNACYGDSYLKIHFDFAEDSYDADFVLDKNSCLMEIYDEEIYLNINLNLGNIQRDTLDYKHFMILITY